MSQSEKDRLAALENRLAILEGQMATEETPGLVRITSSAAVTDSTGLALSAREKNSAISGSIMNKLQEIKSLLSGTGARKVIHRTNAGTGWAGGKAAVSLEEPPGTNLAVILASLSAREGTVLIGTQTVTNNLYFMFRPYSGGKETSIIFDFENKEIRWG